MAAKNAGLTFMVGGPADSFTEAKEILSILGKNVVHCGDVSTGQVRTRLTDRNLTDLSSRLIGWSQTGCPIDTTVFFFCHNRDVMSTTNFKFIKMHALVKQLRKSIM